MGTIIRLSSPRIIPVIDKGRKEKKTERTKVFCHVLIIHK